MLLDFWSLLILFFLAQGMYLLSVLVVSGKQREAYWNRFLAGILLAMLWWLAEFLSVRNVYEVPINIFYGTRYGSWLLLGPLTFFYFKAITQQDWRMKVKDYLHFLPFVILVLLVPLFSGESLSQRQIHYGMLAVFDHRPKTVTLFEYCYSTVYYLQFVHLGVYLMLNAVRIENFGQALRQTKASLDELSWLRLFNGLLLLVLVFAACFLFVLFETDRYRRALDYIYVLPLGLFVYAASYRLAGVQWTRVNLQTEKYLNSSLKETDKDALLQRLTAIMNSKKPYLNPELRLKDLAGLTTMPPHHLSQLINEYHQYSFFDFVNRYRVYEAKQLIDREPKMTLLQIAFAAGFNNKTSFGNAFKKFTGQTPSAFRKTVLAEKR